MPPWSLAIAIALAAAALSFLSFPRTRLRRLEERPHGFAAIRVLLPDELRPYFGVYAPARADLVSYAFAVAWVSVISVLIFAFTLPTWAVILISSACAAVAALAAYAESRSKRIIGPDVIAYVSPLRFLSWSLPLLEVTRCEVVPGSPHPRLRIYTRQGSRLLPLTADLWRVLSAGYA